MTMASAKDMELEPVEQHEPEEQLAAKDGKKGGKEYEKDAILTSLVLIHDHQMGMCLICTLFPLSSFVPMGFPDKVLNEANGSHTNHPFDDPDHGIRFTIQPKGAYMKSGSFYAKYKPKKSPNKVLNFLV